jgi:hypothetical protein
VRRRDLPVGDELVLPLLRRGCVRQGVPLTLGDLVRIALVVVGVAVGFGLLADLIENELRVWRRSREWRP